MRLIVLIDTVTGKHGGKHCFAGSADPDLSSPALKSQILVCVSWFFTGSKGVYDTIHKHAVVGLKPTVSLKSRRRTTVFDALIQTDCK